MKEMIKNTLILLAITVVAGFVLGFVYENTKDTIAYREEENIKASYKNVFSDADYFEEALLAAKTFDVDEYSNCSIDTLNIAYDKDKNALGYVFTITSKEGYGGDITFTVGIRKNGVINGISILSISETAGLGMEADKILRPQFAGKQVEHFVYTKTGSVAPEEIDAISGATVTTNAFTNGVNLGLYYFNKYLGGADNE